MEAAHHHGVPLSRRHATTVFTPALLVSVVVHAALGGILFEHFRHVAVEPTPVLTVKLEQVKPPAIIEAPAPPPPKIQPPAPAPKVRASAPPVPHVPAPTLIAVERVNPQPAFLAPSVAEAPPAPVTVAKAAAPSAAPARFESVEPPHFDVAYLNNPRPAYPPIARKLGIEGVVLLRVDVSARGTPDKIIIAQTSGASLLDEAAMKAVQGWTFVPARRGDAAIPHPVEVPIRFQLKN
jgi:protein TonB